MENRNRPLIITLDGNIGVGKSTLLKQLGEKLKNIEIVLEPVNEWEKLVSEDGKSLLSHFYEDSVRWGYTFQNCAILTRILEIRKALSSTKKDIIITERSVLTDLHVFAKMNHELGNINSLEWELYKKWFDGYSNETPIDAAIYVTTSVETACERIKTRGRKGEGGIPLEYLKKLDEYHHNWLDNTDMPVLKVSTEQNIFKHENIEKVSKFINKLLDNKNN